MASSYGFKHIELRCLGGTLDLPGYFEDRGLGADHVQRWCGCHRIRISSLSTGLKLGDATDPEKDAFVRHLRLAHRMKIRGVRVFDGGQPGVEGPELGRYLDDVRRALAWVHDAVREHAPGVVARVETHGAFSDLRIHGRFLDRQPGGVPLLWDVDHVCRHSGMDPLEAWRRASPVPSHLHLKGGVGRADGGVDYVSLAEGDLDLRPLLRHLGRSGFSGDLSIEWERRWRPSMGPLEAELAAVCGLLDADYFD